MLKSEILGKGNIVGILLTFSLVIMAYDVNSQQLFLGPSTKQPAAAFGYSISHTDLWLIAGAKDDTTQAGRTGAAYFFKYENDVWVEKQKVGPDNGADGDFFGISVSIYGNYAIVGSNGNDAQGINAGAVFVYKNEDDLWIYKQKLMPHAGSGFDEFGIGVSIAKELIVVGAYSDAENGPFSGAAYIYSLVDDNWLEDDKVLPDDGASDDKFGRSVDTDGERVIVCGVLNDDQGEDSGSAYIFSKSGDTWQQEAKLLAPDGSANDRFGRSVGIDHEYAAVGAVLDDDNGNSSGSVYVYHDEANGWQMQQKIIAGDGQAEDFFGYSLSLADRYLIVGAHNDDDFGMNSGSAYLFSRTGVSWTQIEKYHADDSQEGDNYGESVFIDDTWISFGSPYYSTINGLTGAAFTTDAPLRVGIADREELSISVYPNPVAGELHINLPQPYSIAVELTVIDVKGEKVLRAFYQSESSSTVISLDVAGLQQGLYLVRIKWRAGVVTARFYRQ